MRHRKNIYIGVMTAPGWYPAGWKRRRFEATSGNLWSDRHLLSWPFPRCVCEWMRLSSYPVCEVRITSSLSGCRISLGRGTDGRRADPFLSEWVRVRVSSGDLAWHSQPDMAAWHSNAISPAQPSPARACESSSCCVQIRVIRFTIKSRAAIA